MTNEQTEPDMNEVLGDIGHLVHLIDEIMTKILDVDHDGLSKGVTHTLNRASALCWVARDIAERIDAQIVPALRAEREEARSASA